MTSSPMKALLKFLILLLGTSSLAAAQPAPAAEAQWSASNMQYCYILLGFVLLVIVGYSVRRSGQGRRSFRR